MADRYVNELSYCGIHDKRIFQFPCMEIVEHKRTTEDNLFHYDFDAGQSYHFSMKCEELARKIKRYPLKIGVFREGDNFPICHVNTHLNGCACDLASIYTESREPFTFKGPFNLVDPGNNFAGQIGVDIQISNIGKFVITHYALIPSSFVFKNDPEGMEYKCCYKDAVSGQECRPMIEDTDVTDGTTNSNLVENLMRDIAGISPAVEHLALGRPPPKPPRTPFDDFSRKKDKGKTK